MKEKNKSLWIDEKRRVLSFHAFDKAKVKIKPESQYWVYVVELINEGYKVM